MTELGKTCSHGVAWGDHCPECELISARQIIDHWGEMVDEARRVIAEAGYANARASSQAVAQDAA